MTIKNLIYILTCLSFSLICGAALYEHLVVWPKAFAELPRSLTIFQGSYKMNNGVFWQMIHPITLVLFITSLIISWRTERKKHVMLPLIVYALVLAITFIYFVPELLSLIASPYSDTVDDGLTTRANTWETLSIIRGVVLFATAVFLYLGLTKPVVRNVAQSSIYR